MFAGAPVERQSREMVVSSHARLGEISCEQNFPGPGPVPTRSSFINPHAQNNTSSFLNSENIFGKMEVCPLEPPGFGKPCQCHCFLFPAAKA